MAKKDNPPEEGATERVLAPVQTVPAPQAPRQMRVERNSDFGEPMVRHWPQIRGGVCEFCGVLDPNTPSQFQYKLCPHYRGQSIRCSYCPMEKDSDEVVRSTKMEVVEHPEKPGVIIAVCSSYDCEKAHQERFRFKH